MRLQQTALLVNRRLKRLARRQNSPSRRLSRAAAGIGALLGLLLAAALVAGSLAYARLTADLPSTELLPVLLNPGSGLLLEPTRLYDRTGEHLLYALENPGAPRRYAPVDPALPGHISPQMVQVSLEILEEDFWRSPGVSWKNLTAPQPLTIAERLVDGLLLSNEPPSTRRALRMRLLAAQLVARFGRAQVLEWYLNSASFGHLAYGVDSAARLYFGKPAAEINLEEAALLVGIIETPALNPMDSPAAALERQQVVLGQLLAGGIIDAQDYETAKNSPLHLLPPLAEQPTPAAAFSRLVLSRLYQIYGRQRVEQGGMSVWTTLDYDLQIQTACAIQSQLQRLEGSPSAVAAAGDAECLSARLLPTLPPGAANLPAGISASGVLLDLENGQVLALVGDLNAQGLESTFMQSHQPGTLLTPFVAVAGFTRGLSPASLLWDIPSNLPESLQSVDGTEIEFHGPQRFRMAVINDYLAPMAQVIQQVGPGNVWRLSEPFGLSLSASGTDPLSLVYGGGSASPLQMAQAYSTFARLGNQLGQPDPGGTRLQPAVLMRVSGAAGLSEGSMEQVTSSPVLSPQIAYLVHHMLSDQTARWPTLGYPNALEIGRPVGAKVGRVAGGKETWAAGYTPQRLAVFWLGIPADDSAARVDPKMAAGIWHAMIQYASQSQPVADWPLPQGIASVTVCDPSGLLPTADCPSTVTEVFAYGAEPHEYDTLFRRVEINRETNLLATVFTPLELIEAEVYLIPPPEASGWARSAGYAVPPQGYDVIFAPPSVAGVRIDSPVIFGYVRGVVAVRGTAAGEGFASYRLQAGQGLNPRSWVQVGEPVNQAVENGVLTEWDTTQLEDGLYALRLTVVRADQRLETAIIQVTVDNRPPTLRVNSPLPGDEIGSDAGRMLFFDARVEDSVGVERVEWLVDGKLAAESRSAPYQVSWSGIAGEHELVVRAYDLAGNAAASEVVPFTIK